MGADRADPRLDQSDSNSVYTHFVILLYGVYTIDISLSAHTVQAPRFNPVNSPSRIFDLHYSGEAPAVVDAEVSTGQWVDEIVSHPEVFSGHGSNFRCRDVAPGEASPMHRTTTLDYVIVFRGSITLELEEGEKIILNEGDTVVQRGTMHAWKNESTEWAKIYFVMTDAKPVEVGGETLQQEFRVQRAG
ncbi:hypothetical protein MSAN_00828200 [Mycena sanguinolenta]|uniref:Cupin type-2 domain-containing protein n=1 Tax=Mycena sanguinolenta TaxID=230812 RepID=A0A8H7DDK4_9AGAR|nr:hypothetical protein MSAN_00828200 [Mycena sanguinolenta]